MRPSSISTHSRIKNAGLRFPGGHTKWLPALLVACLVYSMSKIVRLIRRCGEYRIRTDGLLHAMQAL